MVVGKKSIRMKASRHAEDIVRVQLYLSRPWKVRAGERVNLTVPFLGLFYLFQAHPFTITWWETREGDKAESVSLMFRARTGFTRKLLNHVEPDREYWAWIDGPFGPSTVLGCGVSKEVGDYGHILMVTSGIGIAAQLPYIKELLERRRNAEVCTQKISLVWQLDRTGDWESARDWLQQLVKQDAGYMLKVVVYDPLKANPMQEPLTLGQHSLITVHNGEANWKDVLVSELRRRAGTVLVTAERLGIHIKSSDVRLKVEEGAPYAWHIEDPSLEPLFNKQLSKHSVGVYMHLCAEVGRSFWAIRADTATSTALDPSLVEQVKVLQSENTVLLEELQEAKHDVQELQQRNQALGKEAEDMKELLNSRNLIIDGYEREIQKLRSEAAVYQASCLQCSEALNQATFFLQGLHSDIAASIPGIQAMTPL
ncbi:ferric reductase transmembrane component 3 [Aspergillus udagawae]|nr:ferric reductase transmembrane component 3 [Aspergillus udagawae]